MTFYSFVPSPVGELLVAGTPGETAIEVEVLTLPGQRRAPDPRWRHEPGELAPVAAQIREYFAGDRREFDLTYRVRGTELQRRVWTILDTIPYGTTTSYGVLTERLGLPRSAVRAVGAAIGANPVLLLRPCHRVVGADGSLVGYAGGLDAKLTLLTHEGARQPQLPFGEAGPA